MNIKTRLISTAVLLITLLGVASAYGSTILLGTLDSGHPLSTGLVSTSGTFTDTYSFNMGTNADTLASAVFFNFSSYGYPNGFSSLYLTFNSSTYDLLAVGSGLPISLGNLPPDGNPYSLSVSGTTLPDGGTYALQLAVVPLPGAGDLMWLGLAILAIVLRSAARRRQKSQNESHKVNRRECVCAA